MMMRIGDGKKKLLFGMIIVEVVVVGGVSVKKKYDFICNCRCCGCKRTC